MIVILIAFTCAWGFLSIVAIRDFNRRAAAKGKTV